MIRVKVDVKPFKRMLERFQPVLRDEGRKLCARAGHIFIGEFRSRPNPRIRPLTGAMTRSLTPIVAPLPNGNRLAVAFAGNKYARIHEEGGVIRPVRGQWLTIPLEDAMSEGEVGRARAPAFKGAFFLRSKGGSLLLVRKKGRGVRLDQKLVTAFDAARALKPPPKPFTGYAKSTLAKPRPSFASEKAARDQDLELLFVLKKEVRMPARLGFGAFWNAFWRGGTGKKLFQETVTKLRQFVERGRT